MMVKLALINGPNLHAPIWMQIMWNSHPPTIERIEHAEIFARQNGIALEPATPQMFSLPPGISIGGSKKKAAADKDKLIQSPEGQMGK